MFEVEQKYKIEDLALLESRLIESRATERPTESHSDIYYNHPCRDFVVTQEALRVRRCNGIPMLTYKGTKLPGKIKARRELEWRLDPGDEDGEKTEELLTLLGFRRVEEVCKTRRSFTFENAETEPTAGFTPTAGFAPTAGFTLTIDDVQNVGLFAEIELVVDDVAQVESARDRISQFALRLGLHQDESRSYLRMLMAANEQND